MPLCLRFNQWILLIRISSGIDFAGYRAKKVILAGSFSFIKHSRLFFKKGSLSSLDRKAHQIQTGEERKGNLSSIEAEAKSPIEFTGATVSPKLHNTI